MSQIPLNALLESYRKLLSEVDDWYSSCLRVGGSALACRGGCSACCRGLFDITLLEAWLLKQAFAGLRDQTRSQVLDRCQLRLTELQLRWPGLKPPFLLNALPEEEWMSMAEDDQTPCPLLDENGWCLVYAARPMTCRLHGLPNIDTDGADFDGTVCTLHPGNPKDLPGQVLRWRFQEVFTREVTLFRDFTLALTGQVWQELDTFIPLALIADYEAFDWCHLKL